MPFMDRKYSDIDPNRRGMLLAGLRELRNAFLDIEDANRALNHDRFSPPRAAHQSPWVEEIQDGRTPTILTREISQVALDWNLGQNTTQFDGSVVFLMNEMNIPEVAVLLMAPLEVFKEQVDRQVSKLKEDLEAAFPDTRFELAALSGTDDFIQKLDTVRDGRRIDYIYDF